MTINKNEKGHKPSWERVGAADAREISQVRDSTGSRERTRSEREPTVEVSGTNVMADYPSKLRRFRILTFCMAIALLGAFFVFAFSRHYGMIISLLTGGLATLVELAEGRSLLKSWRSHRQTDLARHIGPTQIGAERVIRYEGNLHRDRQISLHSKSIGEGSSQQRTDMRDPRIVKLVDKSKQILGKTGGLEKDEFYSEAILSYDRAIRTLLTAVLFSSGIETRGNEIEEWLTHLKRILHNMRLEDVAYLKALRDRINKGYDATKAESQRAREIAWTLATLVFHYIDAHNSKQNLHCGHHDKATGLAT